MILVTLSMMACANVNNMNFCAEPVNSRIEVVVPKSKIESLQGFKYLFSKDIKMDTIAEMIYGTQKTPPNPLPMEMNGCQLTTSNDKSYFYEFPCKELKKEIKSQ